MGNLTIEMQGKAISKIDSRVKEHMYIFEKDLYVLNHFLGINEIDNLTKEFAEAYTRKLIPFGMDPGGWHFCLCMDEKDYGAVIINRWTDYSEEEQFLKTADSFEEFINGLRVEEIS